MFSWRNKKNINLLLVPTLYLGLWSDSFEVPRLVTSNDYSQDIFSWRNKKTMNTFRMKQMSCLELQCYDEDFDGGTKIANH